MMCPWGQAGEEGLFCSILAAPCPNFKGAKDLNDHSNPADGKNPLALLCNPFRNSKAFKELKPLKKMENKSER
jgi:hypothetical protein